MKKQRSEGKRTVAPETEVLLTEQQTGAFLQLTPRALQSYRYKGGGPPYIRISGRCIRYRQTDILKWVDSRIRTSTSDPGLQEGGDV